MAELRLCETIFPVLDRRVEDKEMDGRRLLATEPASHFIVSMGCLVSELYAVHKFQHNQESN